MDWSKNRIMYRYASLGALFGIILFAIGAWQIFSQHQLPLELWSLSYLHRTEPLIFALELAPLVFGIVGGLIGSQRRLFNIIERSKKEWELIFDSISDPILVTDESGKILRCNHALIVRLNSSFQNVLGRTTNDVFGLGDGERPFEKTLQSYNWLGRIYDVSLFPIREQGQVNKRLIVLHDITDRKQAETSLEQTETLFRALLDLLPDAIVVLDPNDPDGLWPILDCNEAASRMNGYRREELIGHSIDVLNGSQGTPAERSAYFQQLREVGTFQLETEHRHKNGKMFPVEVSTTLLTVGGQERIIGIDRDISERKPSEAEILTYAYPAPRGGVCEHPHSDSYCTGRFAG